MSAEDRAVKVLRQAVGHVLDDDECRMAAVSLRDAGLIAPHRLRTWHAGDPEPADVRCVMDRDGDLWMREKSDDCWRIFLHAQALTPGWHTLTRRDGLLIEVRLPEVPGYAATHE